mmetsp:Transcript_21935/g.22873  ORF Transcript_21935/g.22873 Transcript_21935/m.22873 type:complete len:329 (-) Transcript_21935:48-1034(-)
MEKNTIKALQVKTKNGTEFGFVESPIPALKEKEVLIKVHYVPLIHFDLMKMSGVTGATFPYSPCVECSGVIEDAHNKSLIGKKVSYLNLRVGALANRHIATEDEVLILNDDADLKMGSQMSCNPFTASGIVDMAQSLGAKAFAITAGNSAVGKIIIRIAQDKGLTCIPIVRSEQRKKEMEEEGFKQIVSSAEEGFVERLNKVLVENNASVLFDTLAGPIVGPLIKALPKNGIFVNFGTQTHEPYSGIDATDMRWGNKEMKGFLVGPWINKKIEEGTFETHKKYVSDNPKIFAAELGKVYPWEKFSEAVEFTNSSNSSAKTIIEVEEAK